MGTDGLPTGGNVLTPAHLESIRRLEQRIQQAPGYELFCWHGDTKPRNLHHFDTIEGRRSMMIIVTVIQHRRVLVIWVFSVISTSLPHVFKQFFVETHILSTALN